MAQLERRSRFVTLVRSCVGSLRPMLSLNHRRGSAPTEVSAVVPPFLSDPILLVFLVYCLLVVHRAGHLLGYFIMRPRDARHSWPRPVNGGGFWHLLLLPGPGTCVYIADLPDGERRFRWHSLVENAAGPLANLLLGVLLVAAATQAGSWGGPLLISGLCSLLLGWLYGYPRN